MELFIKNTSKILNEFDKTLMDYIRVLALKSGIIKFISKKKIINYKYWLENTKILKHDYYDHIYLN